MEPVPLCEPWPATWCCDTSTLSPTVTGAALQAASEALWALSGHRFGACEVTVRPCRRSCAGRSWSGWWLDVETWPQTAAWPGWLDVACGRCHGGCACRAVSEIELPGFVQQVTEVTVDGEVIPPSGYALYDGRTLTRIGGEWPLCQDWTVPVSGVGAWTVTAVYGRPVPVLGQLAVGELACEIAKACTPGQECRLAANVQSVTRGGVTQVFVDPTELLKAGLTGLRLVDQFINATNPHRLRAGPAIWNPDDYGTPRRPGGVG